MPLARSIPCRKPVLPATELVRNAVLANFERSQVTKACAIDQLVRYCGYTGAEAEREVTP